MAINQSVPIPVIANGFTLIPDKDSTAVITAPKYFIQATFPTAKSIEPMLDPADDEARTIPIGAVETNASGAPDEDPTSWTLKLTLVSAVARNPVVAPMVNFSLWSPLKWVVVTVAVIFQDQVREALKRCLLAPARRIGWGKKQSTDEESTTASASGTASSGEGNGNTVHPDGIVGHPPGGTGRPRSQGKGSDRSQ